MIVDQEGAVGPDEDAHVAEATGGLEHVDGPRGMDHLKARVTALLTKQGLG